VIVKFREVMFVMISAACGTSCGSRPPAATALEAVPGHVCRGTPTTVHWTTANGRTMLSVTPVGLRTTSSSVPNSGSQPFGIFHPTDFLVEVHAETGSAPPRSLTAHADLFAGSTTSNLGRSVACTSSTGPLSFDATIVPEQEGLWNDLVIGNRPMTVTHDGHTATVVNSSQPSPGLRGTILGGAYHVEIQEVVSGDCATGGGNGNLDVQLTVSGSCPEHIPNSTVPPVTEPSQGVGVPGTWSECGGEGQGCCGAATCQRGLTCQQLSICTRGNAPATTCNGATPMNAQSYPFLFKDDWGCAISGSLRSFLANSAEEAHGCAETAGARSGAHPGTSLMAHNRPFHRGAGAKCEQIQPAVLDDADAETCAMHIWCPDSQCGALGPPVAGDCPMDDAGM
jgi:hypothetical protein